MVNGCQGGLHSDLMAEIVEHVVVELLGVVDYDVSRDVIAIDDILPEIFLMVAELMFVTGPQSILCNTLLLRWQRCNCLGLE
jgi:hypothetical protein